ncbi:unnamed protein product [Nippostrongylus brasiliensis]|uniref:N-acetyltransferase domain-containing protein n=1 Tax=Nippostrongylus brasiliensis TaxID=27835 RepID=A0A0N4YM19_NIPBR|nr:hypothetical protein Q1695_006360 [Nippostrongylus brasiliensis]VDL81911.1 unnamed protein product [Nippostrongylus brasiliensis]
MVEFQYFIATMEERCEIRRFLMEHFLIEETMNVATGITEEEFSPFADATLDSSLRTPFSVVCRDGSGAIAGVALSAVINRNEETISNPLGAPKRPEIQAISSICEEVHGSIWQLLDANINIVLDLEILSVGLPHQRQGIAGKMLEKRESPPLLQASLT